MENGSIFERDGISYETCADGVEHVADNKSKCIRPKGESKCVTVKQAIKDGFIRQISNLESDDLFSGPQKGAGDKSKTGVLKEPPSPDYPRSRSDNVYYLPVDQLRAQVFLVHGLIYPAVYDKAGLSADFDDIQRLAPTELTLFDTLQSVKENQLLLSVLLSPDDVANAERTGTALRLAMPVPISRLAGIGVPRESGEIDRYVNGWSKPDVPCPRSLFYALPKEKAGSEGGAEEPSPLRNAKPIPDVTASIEQFDRYMGVLAFIRNAARYFSERTGFYADYPDAFLQIVERLLGRTGLADADCGPVPPLLLALLDLDTAPSTLAETVLTLAKSQEPYIEKERARALATAIYKGAGSKETLAQAFKTLFSGDYRSAIHVLQSPGLPVEAAVLAALFKFSNRQSGDHRTVKQRLHEDWSNQGHAQLALAALGAYHGYTAIDARETSLYSVHQMIRPLIEERPAIKFTLDSILEREVIEALHQRTFAPSGPMVDTNKLFKALSANRVLERPQVPRVLVQDRSYIAAGVLVRRYQVTLLGRIIQHLRAWKGDTIDERSEVGRYLMSQCFFLADEYELSKRSGRQTLHYRISKSKVIDLITEQQIAVNPRVLEAALEEDARADVR